MEERLSDKYRPNQQQEDSQQPLSAIGQDFSGDVDKEIYSNLYSNTGGLSYVQRMINKSREAMMLVMVGEMGVGKSNAIIKLGKGYIKDNPATGKKARPFFIFDANFEPEYAQAFPKFIRPYEITKQLPPDGYRILPVKDDNTQMDDDELREAMIHVAIHSSKCGVAFDDIDGFFEGAKPRQLSRLYMGIRHKGGRDVIFTHQRLSVILPAERAAATVIQLRHSSESVTLTKDRWRNPQLLAIAENMIEEQYSLAELKYNRGEITEEQYKIHRGFFVDCDMWRNKIIGAYSKKCFIRNCKKYLNMNPNIITNFQKMHCDKDGKIVVDRFQAIEKIINTQLWRYYAGRE